jgi:hypothetical protein
MISYSHAHASVLASEREAEEEKQFLPVFYFSPWVHRSLGAHTERAESRESMSSKQQLKLTHVLDDLCRCAPSSFGLCCVLGGPHA